MGYAAVACLEDAVDATREFLLPVDRSRWLRLAVVVFFLSGGSGIGSLPNVTGQFSAIGGGDIEVGPVVENGQVTIPSISETLWVLLLALIAVVLVLGLVFVLIGSVMEFVLVDALRTESVTVRAAFRRYFRAGVGLFAFRFLLGLVVLVPLGVLAIALFAPLVDGSAAAGWVIASVLLFAVIAIVVGFIAALVHGLTVEFVVPVMVAAECGILSAWRRFWPTLRGNIGEVAIYIVVRWGIAIAVSIIAGIVTGIFSAIVLIPLFIVGAGFIVVTGATVSPLVIVGVAALVAIGLLAVIAMATAVQIPLKTFTRYFELLVLGDLEPEFDLAADRRASIRENT